MSGLRGQYKGSEVQGIEGGEVPVGPEGLSVVEGLMVEG